MPKTVKPKTEQVKPLAAELSDFEKERRYCLAILDDLIPRIDFIAPPVAGFYTKIGLKVCRDRIAADAPGKSSTVTAPKTGTPPTPLEALELILPLAERYLAKAPSSPDNMKLEDARWALSIGKAATQS
jgi:hypothetical protein